MCAQSVGGRQACGLLRCLSVCWRPLRAVLVDRAFHHHSDSRGLPNKASDKKVSEASPERVLAVLCCAVLCCAVPLFYLLNDTVDVVLQAGGAITTCNLLCYLL